MKRYNHNSLDVDPALISRREEEPLTSHERKRRVPDSSEQRSRQKGEDSMMISNTPHGGVKPFQPDDLDRLVE